MSAEIKPAAFALVDRLLPIIDAEPDAVARQMAIELVMVRFASARGSHGARLVIDGMSKHAKQMLEQR